MAPSNHFHEQLASVNSAYSVHLKKQADLLKTLWQQTSQINLKNTASLDSILDIVHDLHGQGLTFGYPEISDLAEKLEASLLQIKRASASDSDKTYKQIDEYINALINAAFDKPSSSHLFKDPSSITDIDSHKPGRTRSEKPKQILLIEDAGILRHRISISLKQAGYEIIEAVDGHSGLEIAYKTTPDLILLDLMLPDIDGFEVHKKIRTHDDLINVPLIFLTSINRVSISQIQTALSYGITDYISKPFIMDNLMSKIKTHLV